MSLRKTITGLILLNAVGTIHAQDAVPAAGGSATTTGGSISYSVGQVVYTAHTGPNGSVSQGVQHTYDIFNGIEERGTDISLAAYPNPVTDALTLSVEESNLEGLTFEVYNSQGQLVSGDIITASQTQVSMKDLSTATYFLNVKKHGQVIQSFTIIKK